MPDELVKAVARKRLITFSRYMQPTMEFEPFHVVYYTLLDMFAHGKIKKMIVQQPPQHGKLLSDETLIPTPNGMRKHGDLKVDDYVFGRDGVPVKVLWVSDKAQCEYTVKFSDGASVDCHGRHEWTVYNRTKHKEETLETQYIASTQIYKGNGKRGSKYKYQIDSSVTAYFEAQKTEIDPYTLGAWLGDGKSSAPQITIGCGDFEIIDNIPYKASSHWVQKNTGVDYFYFGKAMNLRAYNLINNKHIPDAYKYNTVEVRKQVIAGLIDTDGFVYQKNGRVTISNTNKRIIDDAAFILRSLGQKVAICSFAPKVSTSGVIGKKTVYALCFNPTFVFPTKVERKKIKKLSVNKKRAIVSIEKKENLGFGNCIQVEGGIYLVGETFIPTHNSEGSSRKLPAFMLGMNPDLKICIGSYSTTIANDFNRDIQRIIDSKEYRDIFPNVLLSGSGVNMPTTYVRNSDVFEIVGHKGSLRVVGRGGSLTSKTVDISILDDVYKDYAEGNSPVIREAAWKWYTTVVRTRLHNDSQELIVFTRWHEDDLIGRLEKSGEKIIDVTKWSDLNDIPKGAWVRINFEGLKESEPTEIDPRQKGEALWEERHSKEKLEAQKKLDPVQFQCLFQGNPSSAAGRLYRPFKTWTEKSEWGKYIRSGCYVDVADEGSDFLFAATYDVYQSDNLVFNERTKRMEPLLFALITDVEYTDESTDVTTITVPNMINRNGTQKAWIESNNGGSGFEKVIRKKVRAITEPFHQSGNKESRIITQSATVNQCVIFPFGWEVRYKAVFDHLTNFLRNFRANAHDDIEDGLTGIVEKELADGNTRPYAFANRGVKLRN